MKKANFCYAALAASAVLALGSAMTSFAAEWQMQNSEWVYVENSGELARDVWRADNGKDYYLGSDGYMVRSSIIEWNDSYYYVNSSGACVYNEWRFLENPSWQGDELVGESSWYYFGSNGRAYRTTADKVEIATIGDKKYAFDMYGRMMTGWISESGEYVSDEEWQNGVYYGDSEGDGNLVTNAWVYIAVQDDDNEDDPEPTYHFYFNANGKKTISDQKSIGSQKYEFDERGVALSGWVHGEDGSWLYYGDAEEPYLHTGWFQAVPDEDLNADGYSDGTVYWYYASSKGVITTSELKSIDGKTYGFNSRGELITGLKILTMADDSTKEIASIASVDYIENMPSGADDERAVIYFGSDGAVQTGVKTVSVDGTDYTFYFKTSGSPRGAGHTGTSDGYLYDHGLRLTAEEGTKYQRVTYAVDGKTYLLNESGTIQKKKKNLKDVDGYYYCTYANGTVMHGPLDEKCTESTHDWSGYEE